MALAFLAHLRAISGGFHFDDFHHIVNNPAVKNFPGALYFFTHPESFSLFGKFTLYRPVTLLSFALNHELAGTDPRGWLVFNVLIHALNAGLVFLLLGKWLGKARPAFCGALLFAFMAMLSQPVNYLSDRATLLASGFVMLALVLDAPGPAGEDRQGLKRLLLILACFWLGLLSKETAAVFPALALIADRFLTRRKYDQFRIFSNALYWANLGLFLLLRWKLFHTLGSNFHPRGFGQNLLIQAQALFFYIAKILFPVQLSILPDIDPVRAVMIISLGALAAISVLALVLSKRAGGFAFIWFWFLIGLLPSSVIALNVLASEERAYLSSLGLALGLAWLIERARESRAGLAYICFGAVLFCQLVLLELRIPAFHSEFSLWRDAIEKSPRLSETYNMYAAAFLRERDYGKAREYYNRGLRHNSRDPQAYAGLAAIYLKFSKPEEVLKSARAYQEVSAHPWQQADALGYQALAESLRGNFEDAERLAQSALEKNPGEEKGWYVMARASLERGDLEKAVEYGQRALAANPDFPEAHGLLGYALVQAHKIDAGIYHLEKYVELAPDQAAGWLNLSVAYAQRPDLGKARSAVENALRLKPDYALAYNQLAAIEWNSANPEKAIEIENRVIVLDPDLVVGHRMLAGFLLSMVEVSEYRDAAEKKALLGKVREQMEWLNARQVDTAPLEERLKKLR